MTINQFLATALVGANDCWSQETVGCLAGLAIPDFVFGRNGALLKGDINRAWACWFATGVVAPSNYLSRKGSAYVYIYADALKALDALLPSLTKPERVEIGKLVAAYIDSSLEFERRINRRRVFSYQEKWNLLDIAGENPRCWICGSAFSQYAIDMFLGRECSDSQKLPEFIDVVKPIGLIERDLAIEVDHIYPLSKGGGEDDNLGLACGLCNRHKSARTSIYESRGVPRTCIDGNIQFRTLPQPFWTVRLLALRRRREHLDGCSATCENAELTVAPISMHGAFTPTNLRVTCSNHVPLKHQRLLPRREVLKTGKDVTGD